jgi:hypothetical protein
MIHSKVRTRAFNSTRLRVTITVSGCSAFLLAATRAVRRNAEEAEESAVH